MSKTILDFKNDLIGVGHGLNLNKVYDPFAVLTRAKDQMISELDMFEIVQERQIANSIFDSIYDYPSPANLKMDKVVDIYPQVRRDISDKFGHQYSEDFDRKKSISSDMFTVEYRNGVKVLRASQKYTDPSLQPLPIGNFSSLTSNGTWTLGGDATDLTLDMVNYVSGTASLRFNLSGVGTTWYIENSGINPYDLTTRIDGSLFDWVWLPDSAKHTSLMLRWGSSASDYYEVTNTAQYFSAFVDGWNQMENVFANATTVGSPDITDITYIRISGVYNGDVIDGMRVDSVTAILGSKFLVKYYNNTFIVDATTGAYKETVNDDSDIVALENVSYNGYLYICAQMMAQQVQNQGGSIDIEYFIGLYEQWKKNYGSNYKTQSIKPKASYYRAVRGRGYTYQERKV